MRHAATTLLVGLMLALPALARAESPRDRKIYEEGLHSVMEMDWDGASDAFDRLIERYPDSAYQDDALFWRGFARVESGDCVAAYSTLEALENGFPESPRVEAARSLRVRCAGELLADQPDDPRAAEYARLINRTTRDDSLSARLSAADVLVTARPVEGANAINRLASELDEPSLLDMVLERHFGSAQAVALAADPSMPLGPANAVILVRAPEGLDALSVAEALQALDDGSPRSYSDRVRSSIRMALDHVRRTLYHRQDDPGTVDERSSVVQIEDTEIHLYRNSDEVVRILVLDRDQGYHESNVRVYVERDGTITEVPVRDAERMAARGDTRLIGERSLTFVGSSLALIQLDLEGATALAGEEPAGPPLQPVGFTTENSAEQSRR